MKEGLNMEITINDSNVAVLKQEEDRWFDFKFGFNALFVKDVLFYDSMGVVYNGAQATERMAGYQSNEEKLICEARDSFFGDRKRKKYEFASKIIPCPVKNGAVVIMGNAYRSLFFKNAHNASLCYYVIMRDIDNKEMSVEGWTTYARNCEQFERNFIEVVKSHNSKK